MTEANQTRVSAEDFLIMLAKTEIPTNLVVTEDVYLVTMIIESNVDLKNTHFEGTFHCQRAEFRGDVNFNDAKFCKGFHFEHATFRNPVRLGNAVFFGRVHGGHASFKDTFQTESAHFANFKPDWFGATFSNNVPKSQRDLRIS